MFIMIVLCDHLSIHFSNFFFQTKFRSRVISEQMLLCYQERNSHIKRFVFFSFSCDHGL